MKLIQQLHVDCEVDMKERYKFIVITDVGSTMTKAVLVGYQDQSLKVLGISHAETTVEVPLNDVKIGVLKAIRELETATGIRLLGSSAENTLSFRDEVGYLTTSSAGGGLQILVIGLTLFDSASSGKRAAYGAGGIILDTFALNDKRKAVDQMLAMRNQHPDLVLICGGTDGGAITGVLRLVEILRLANPAPKFNEAGLIPAIYAGNVEASSLIQKMISAYFDLHILPNLRPSPVLENLKPTQDMIQKLFMENVMEKAPGYTELKQTVNAEILPTPVGVMQCLKLLSHDVPKNTLAVDIGGATTDVFTILEGVSQRTVSANLGMSYSALNVLKEYGAEKLMQLLPESFPEQQVRNYIGNKTINPTSVPVNEWELRLEHALAKAAIELALVQHQEMHYNTRKIGFLDLMKQGLRDKFETQFEFQREDDKLYFYGSDIDIMLGSGGIFANVPKPEQAMMILIDSLKPKGVTELWLDKSFCSPHIGILSTFDHDSAQAMLHSDLIEPLAIHVSPLNEKAPKKDKVLLQVEIDGKRSVLCPDNFVYYPGAAAKRKIRIIPGKEVLLGNIKEAVTLETDLPLILDTRQNVAGNLKMVDQAMGLYGDEPIPEFKHVPAASQESTGNFVREIYLPYKGEVYATQGQKTRPDDIMASNPYDPARLYIVQPFGSVPSISSEYIGKNLLIRQGDKVDFDQVIARLPHPNHTETQTGKQMSFHSPVRGKVEFIDPKTGLVVMSEIQDYTGKPVKINVASQLKVKPNRIGTYLLRNVGDYVYQGDTIARKLDSSSSLGRTHIVAPSTGTLTTIDKISGEVTICFQSQPHEYHAQVFGEVLQANEQDVQIEYHATRIEAKLGFGKETGGKLVVLTDSLIVNADELHGTVVATGNVSDLGMLESLADAGINGLICDNIDEMILCDYLKTEPGVINTGEESLPFSLIIRSGFASPIDDPGGNSNYTRYAGQYVYLNPHTRLRAGVIRPTINIIRDKA